LLPAAPKIDRDGQQTDAHRELPLLAEAVEKVV
jgi:hypothetical protein